MRKKEQTHRRSGWAHFLKNISREWPKKLEKDGHWSARLDPSHNPPCLVVSVPLDAPTSSQKEWFLKAANHFKNHIYKYSNNFSNPTLYAKLKYHQGGNLKRKARAHIKKLWIRAEYRELSEETRNQLDERIRNLQSDRQIERKRVLNGKSRFEKCAFLIQENYRRIKHKDLSIDQIKKAIYS